MGILMKENTIRLQSEALKTYAPLVVQLWKEGCSQSEVEIAIRNHTNLKARKLYKEGLRPTLLGNLLTDLSFPERDSKIEYIFSNLLSENKIKFREQYNIGSYKADFLINDFLVVEIDGPHHGVQEQIEHDEKRDNYMRKMGYKVLRVPVWVLSLDMNAVISEVKEIID